MSPAPREPATARPLEAGLCAECRHGRRIVSARGSEFWLCERGTRREPGFARYPRLPVRACPGKEPAA